MAAPSLDNEFMEYWSKLSVVQKQSLLSIVKFFARPQGRISLEQYNKEIEEALVEIEKGEVYTHEEVVKISKGW